MPKDQLIREALSQSSNVTDYYISQILTLQFPNKAIIEGNNIHFDIEEFAQDGQCQFEHHTHIHNQILTHWQEPDLDSPNQRSPSEQAILRAMDYPMPENYSYETVTGFSDPEIIDRSKNAWFIVQWQGHTFEVIFLRRHDHPSSPCHYWILAESKEIAKKFMVAVCKWNSEIRGEVLVFESGYWRKNARFFEAIQGVTFDNLILKGSLKQDIREDLERFFRAKTTYEEYGIPWKRGILFVGPPGNGKTHAIKAIINTLNKTCLYVKSFNSEHDTDEDNIRTIFERARKSAPCILVLEDLDSLLTQQNRSFFLNELDGFASNTGILTLATTNHPEQLDPAIVDRPSRFDRKYPFNLPEVMERQAYISMWNTSLKSALHLSDDEILYVAEQTNGFSFAYLKELFLSALMHWMNKQENETMGQVMIAQARVLRDQMVSGPQGTSTDGEQGEDKTTGRRNVYLRR